MLPTVFPSSDPYITALFCSAVGIGLNHGTQQGTQHPAPRLVDAATLEWRESSRNRPREYEESIKGVTRYSFEFPHSSA